MKTQFGTSLSGIALLFFSSAVLPQDPRYNEVQFKAAHNSIDREESLTAQLDWDPKEPANGGCRGLELDIVQDPKLAGPGDTWVFGVQHGGPYTPQTPGLARCLREVRQWADAHPGHDVITIHIDLKEEATLGDDKVFAAQIDRVFAGELGKERILAPFQLERDAPTLLEGIKRHGWPSLKDLRGKFIIIFSGGDGDEPVARRRRAYFTTSRRDRLAFVDLDQRAAGAKGGDECDIKSSYYQEGWRVFVNIELGRKDWARLGREARRQGFVTREWKANDEASWRAAREAGINILSTDRIRNHLWATVGPTLLAPMPSEKRPER